MDRLEATMIAVSDLMVYRKEEIKTHILLNMSSRRISIEQICSALKVSEMGLVDLLNSGCWAEDHVNALKLLFGWSTDFAEEVFFGTL